MHVLGYLVTMANLQSLAGTKPEDISIRVGPLQDITEELRSLPINLDGFRQTGGYQRFGPIGVYISKTVQDYIFKNQGSPQDEGLMLFLFFKQPGAQDRTSSSVVENGRQTLFLHKYDVPDNIKAMINTYAQTGKWPDQAIHVRT